MYSPSGELFLIEVNGIIARGDTHEILLWDIDEVVDSQGGLGRVLIVDGAFSHNETVGEDSLVGVAIYHVGVLLDRQNFSGARHRNHLDNRVEWENCVVMVFCVLHYAYHCCEGGSESEFVWFCQSC